MPASIRTASSFYMAAVIAVRRRAFGGFRYFESRNALPLLITACTEDPFPAAQMIPTPHTMVLDRHQRVNTVVGAYRPAEGLTCALLSLKTKATLCRRVPFNARTDPTQSGDTMQTNAESDPVICKRTRPDGRPISQRRRFKTPPASPLYGDFKGLPPMLVQVGTTESMYDDSRRYAEAASRRRRTFEPWDDMFHGRQQRTCSTRRNSD